VNAILTLNTFQQAQDTIVVYLRNPDSFLDSELIDALIVSVIALELAKAIAEPKVT